MGSWMDETKLIPGFRFHPTDVELVKYYLKRKVMGKRFSMDVIAEVDIFKYAPWDLPDKSSLRTGDLEWYFFCPKGTKYASGSRVNRATEVGYWKTTGRYRLIRYKNQIVGTIKTLVFHTGRAPRGDRTDWVLHEYKLEDKELTDKGIPQDSYVLCRVFQKDGLGPKNGAHYGKPFNEEEWSNDEEELGGVEPVLSTALPAPISIVPATQYNSVLTDWHLLESECIGQSSVSCQSGPKPSPSPCMMPPSSPREDKIPPFCGNNNIEVVDNCGWENDANGMTCLDINNFLKDLGDLNNFAGLGQDGHHCTCDQQAENSTNQMFPTLDFEDFLDLVDLHCSSTLNIESGINLIQNEKETR